MAEREKLVLVLTKTVFLAEAEASKLTLLEFISFFGKSLKLFKSLLQAAVKRSRDKEIVFLYLFFLFIIIFLIKTTKISPKKQKVAIFLIATF